ncbi:MAG: hypothetical protein RR573_06945 [Oscillospiraceae bacterium]
MRYIIPTHLLMKLRKFVLLIILAVCAMVAVFLAFKFNASPAAAINRDYKSSAYEHSQQVALAPIKCNKGAYVYIYTTAKGELASAVLDKGLLGYQLRSVSGFIANNNFGTHISTTYSRFFGNYTITWGVENNTLTDVTVGEAKGEIIDYNGAKLWFACEKSVIKPGKIEMIGGSKQ